jgi:methyltransferase (TIGR00027 family)
METGQPSRTALGAAAHRAAHQSLDEGRIFADPLALAVLGAAPAEIFGDDLDRPANRAMRAFIAARSRFAEESLAAAAARGVRQYVVLGAGLDTFAHRNPFVDAGLRVFEVDHPATQAWKRRRLAEAGLASPGSLSFAPVDFERQTLAAGLAAAGFDAGRPAFFSWLGVVVYLTRPAVVDTLAFIAALPAGAAVVFD